METNIVSLAPNEIFVFGSNEAGRHGKGAALYALKNFGAKYGQGYGIQGKSFAIPTKDFKIKTLPLENIKEYLKMFIEYSTSNQQLTFLMTPIGTGLAGYTIDEMKNLFKELVFPKNVILPNIFM